MHFGYLEDRMWDAMSLETTEAYIEWRGIRASDSVRESILDLI